jgi:hypothetical protein
MVSRRTAQNLHNSYYGVPELHTIPEGAVLMKVKGMQVSWLIRLLQTKYY